MWEDGLLENLFEVLEGCARSEREDAWWWKLEEEGRFTVRSSYELLAGLMMPPETLSESKEMVFGSVWKSPALSKVVVFSWQLLLDHIPTKVNLVRRTILPADASDRCVFCDQAGETSSHLFLHCNWFFYV